MRQPYLNYIGCSILALDNHFWVESLIPDYQGSVYTLSFIDASEICIDRRV